MAQGGWAQTTQAGPAPGLVFGGFWIRFVAYIVDAFILMLALIVVAVVIVGLAVAIGLGVYLIFALLNPERF